MKIPNKFFLLGTLLLILSTGCSSEKENKKESLVEDSKYETIASTELIKELKTTIPNKTIYSINNKNYQIDSLPNLYKEMSGKNRKLFLEAYLNYKVTLDTLIQEQNIYKKEIDEKIKKELEQISYRGINQNILDKTIYIQKLTLEKIALEEVSKKEENLTEKLAEFYANNRDKFKYSDNVEISFILLKEKNKAEAILKELNNTEITIHTFSKLASSNSIDPQTRINDGYAGYMSKDSAGDKLFDKVWSHSKLGLINEVLEKENKFLLIYIHKKIKSDIKIFDSVKDEIKEKLLRGKKNNWIKQKYNNLMEKTKIKIYDSFEDNQTF